MIGICCLSRSCYFLRCLYILCQFLSGYLRSARNRFCIFCCLVIFCNQFNVLFIGYFFFILGKYQIIQILRDVQALLNCTEDLHELFTCNGFLADQIFRDLIHLCSVTSKYPLGLLIGMVEKLHHLMIDLCCGIITTV